MSARGATGAQLWVLNRLGWLKLDTDSIERDVDAPVSAAGSVTNERASELIALAFSRGLYTPHREKGGS
jgi:hypothetical protein